MAIHSNDFECHQSHLRVRFQKVGYKDLLCHHIPLQFKFFRLLTQIAVSNDSGRGFCVATSRWTLSHCAIQIHSQLHIWVFTKLASISVVWWNWNINVNLWHYSNRTYNYMALLICSFILCTNHLQYIYSLRTSMKRVDNYENFLS